MLSRHFVDSLETKKRKIFGHLFIVQACQSWEALSLVGQTVKQLAWPFFQSKLTAALKLIFELYLVLTLFVCTGGPLPHSNNFCFNISVCVHIEQTRYNVLFILDVVGIAYF